ncbi:MAG: DNA topoisomerase VI subunit B [Pirellulales bacterium]|nr:DNA topoisomerase VI subunit B [Pirellulales bacterium]
MEHASLATTPPPPVKRSATNSSPSHSGANGQAARRLRRRATAQSMAASQRDISVSEFFAKNRHLLGFDSPRRALLTAVKEAVDNALDACEEAGILPEIWVHVQRISPDRYKVGVQDNGPGILKKTIPLIFGKLLYGSKFHRLRMSRGQQGIGISAAGMYGMLTTGKPIKIMSKISRKDPAHYYEIQIDTKRNLPEILNGRGDGVEVPPGAAGQRAIDKHGIEWEDLEHGTRVTIELEGKYQRGRGSVDEYLEQTAIANPHVAIHYTDPDEKKIDYARVAENLPPEPKEIKPHPYGVELGHLVTMLKDTKAPTIAQFLGTSFSRVSRKIAKKICEKAGVKIRSNPKKSGRHEADLIYKAIQETKIPAPTTDCISPIGEELIIKGLHHIVPGEFYTAATRPPAVYRGNPFVIEVGLAYGGAAVAHRVGREALAELIEETDARTLRQFLITTFNGIGADGADKILAESALKTRVSPGNLKKAEIDKLHEALQNVNVSDGQSMNILRYANRVPLQFQAGACAITQTVMQTNWRAYGLQQSRGSLPAGPVTLMVHMASVWVPFTSESKEAVASYPQIQKEIRLALQAVGRKLGMYLRRRRRVHHEGQRRNLFLRYVGEVAGAVSSINKTDRQRLYDNLMRVARKRTAEADTQLDDRGRKIDENSQEFGEHVLIVEQAEMTSPPTVAS